MDLLSCPFCGCDAVEVFSSRHLLCHGDYVDEFAVFCKVCGCSGPPVDDCDRLPEGDIISLAVHRWNQRLYAK